MDHCRPRPVSVKPSFKPIFSPLYTSYVGIGLTDDWLCGSSVGSMKDLQLNRYLIELSMRPSLVLTGVVGCDPLDISYVYPSQPVGSVSS